MRLSGHCACGLVVAAILSLAPAAWAGGKGKAPDVGVTVAGPEEVVFQWLRDRCDDGDIPDLPVRAFRDHLDRVQLLGSHYRTRRWIGPSLDTVTHDCKTVMGSTGDPAPSRYNGQEWLAAVHTEDGRHIIGFVHNEHQGHRYPDQCPSGDYDKCWYNSITMAESVDGGESYSQRPAPGHRVASQPYRYEPDVGPSGYFEPSNIVTRDGWAYMLVRTMPRGAQDWGTCILRSSTPGDPTSWRAWDGGGFNTRFINPYLESTETPERHVCAPISRDQIQTMHESLTWNTAAGQWLLVGISADLDDTTREVVWGVYYSVSTNLIDWSPRALLLPGVVPWTYGCGDPDPIHYPSLLDPASGSRTFATSGETAYLYFTRFHYQGCAQTLDRDLVRVPIKVTVEPGARPGPNGHNR